MFNFCYRSQTTKGIWIAKAVGIEPFTVVMDLEGTDGRERGEVLNFSFCILYSKHSFFFKICIFEYNVNMASYNSF